MPCLSQRPPRELSRWDPALYLHHLLLWHCSARTRVLYASAGGVCAQHVTGGVYPQHLTQVVYIPNIGAVYAQNVAGGVYPQHARKCYNTYKEASQRLKG